MRNYNFDIMLLLNCINYEFTKMRMLIIDKLSINILESGQGERQRQQQEER